MLLPGLHLTRRGCFHYFPMCLSGKARQDNDIREQEHEGQEPFDEYKQDLDKGDYDMYDLFAEAQSSSTSKRIIRDPLGEEMFSPHNIRHPRSAEW
ncbi:hypothetical protein NDU88_002130 [Pleurodeles waltl]|uniref:Uncharacterized protein n=1 Tax=Pleurodeles waltl TaxID=8319 RepID=A0AAV7W100_PLEWA|nr:hypothetical protein NDU88_002130 [Pleurodeles waltl]